jgi:hypothetical protein
MLKRKVSCTFKRKITLEIQERIYPFKPLRFPKKGWQPTVEFPLDEP